LVLSSPPSTIFRISNQRSTRLKRDVAKQRLACSFGWSIDPYVEVAVDPATGQVDRILFEID
jgi:hypothetical protein